MFLGISKRWGCFKRLDGLNHGKKIKIASELQVDITIQNNHRRGGGRDLSCVHNSDYQFIKLEHKNQLRETKFKGLQCLSSRKKDLSRARKISNFFCLFCGVRDRLPLMI